MTYYARLINMHDYDQPIDPATDPRNLVDKYKGWPNSDVKRDLAEHAFDFHIAIENYQHDFNIGTIVRNANAFNCAGVHIIGKRKWNRRGAMVTDKYLQLYHHASVDDFRLWLEGEGLAVVGVDNVEGSILMAQAPLPTTSMLVFGQEGPGLSPEMREICSQIVAIEQFGSTRSVNVGVASGIVMYEWVRRNQLS